MTRKDFQLIAGVINDMIGEGHLSYNDAIMVAYRFESALADTNEQFDRKRFYEAATKSLKRRYHLRSLDSVEEEGN